MSGILDNKSRVIDALLTYEGRRQMATGNFTVKYATFSDSSVIYQPDELEGHVDPTKKIYLESFNVPHDQVTFESDDSGKLVPFRQHSSIDAIKVMGPSTGSVEWMSFVNGKIKSRLQTLSTSSNVTGRFSEEAISGSIFASQMEGILASSIDNFQKLRIIGTVDPIFEDQDFALSSNEVEFTILKNAENLQMVRPTLANTIDSLFNDEKLRNVDNFRYLPPIKKTNSLIDKADIETIKNLNLLLGDYQPWGPVQKLTFSDLKSELNKYEDYSKVIAFDPTSRDNDIVAQFFEINNNEAKKLDVIEYGRISDNSANPKAISHHVFFVGKVIVDDNGTDCFVHLFTLVFSPDEEA